MGQPFTRCLLMLSVCAVSNVACRGNTTHVHDAHALGTIYPRVSPDGGDVVVSYQGAIWRLPATGGVMTRLTGGDGFDIEPAWSPDSQHIAFIRSGGFYGGRLQLIRAEDGTAVPLPRPVVARDKLCFAPDSSRILANFEDESRTLNLAWYDLSTGELSAPIRSATSRQPHALSPGGDRIAWTESLDRDGEQGGNNGPAVDVFVVAAAGGTPERITRFPARIYDMCWAADGQSLFVVTDLGGAHNNVWQMPLHESDREAVQITFGLADEDCPSVSADGQWLFYTDNHAGATTLVRHDLHTGRMEWPAISEFDFRSQTGSLQLQELDEDTQQPVTARVSVRHADGSFHAPPGSLYRLLNRDLHFYAESQAEFTVPVGDYRIEVARGPEYRIWRQTVTVRADEVTSVDVSLQRWTDQRARGWYSGESHIHANYGYGHWYNSPRTMLAQCAGEDLLVCNLMVANSDGDGVFDREFFRGRPDSLSTTQTVLYWNEEYRSTIWGHMTLLNLKQLVEPIFNGFANTTNPHDHPTNADIADHAHDQDGHVNYTHPAQNPRDPYLGAYTAKELPIDVALGKVDSIDVMGSNHVANMPLWYRLLNCGFHVSASAGTDCFLNRIPSRTPGSDRAYVKIDGEFGYEAWITNLQTGRSFVTNGPMLDFTVNDLLPGDTLRMDTPGLAAMRAQVRSQYPVDRVELIFNGEAVAAADIAGDGHDVTFERDVEIPGSGWMALRVSGPRHPDQPRGDVFAHTTPVYIEVRDQPLTPGADATYFVEWTNRLWDDVRKRNRIPRRHLSHVETQIMEARAIFERLAGR